MSFFTKVLVVILTMGLWVFLYATQMPQISLTEHRPTTMERMKK